MLEIVQHQQARAIAEVPRQGFGRVLPEPIAHTHHAGDCGEDERRIGQRRQVDEPDPSGEALACLLRRGDGQAGLADPARPPTPDRRWTGGIIEPHVGPIMAA